LVWTADLGVETDFDVGFGACDVVFGVGCGLAFGAMIVGLDARGL
jgi:hypothetical protein